MTQADFTLQPWAGATQQSKAIKSLSINGLFQTIKEKHD